MQDAGFLGSKKSGSDHRVGLMSHVGVFFGVDRLILSCPVRITRFGRQGLGGVSIGNQRLNKFNALHLHVLSA